jgi:antitoxin component of RelBE/YafQ-DinJ toxin-antitoxin module
MTTELNSIVSFKLDERTKRRFDAAMRAMGTTVSETMRKAVLQYLDEADAGIEHPQFRLDLVNDDLMAQKKKNAR